MSSPTKECTCTPTERCAEHLINDALTDTAKLEDLQVLTTRVPTSLADLYRKAKQRGVLTSFSEYPQ